MNSRPINGFIGHWSVRNRTPGDAACTCEQIHGEVTAYVDGSPGISSPHLLNRIFHSIIVPLQMPLLLHALEHSKVFMAIINGLVHQHAMCHQYTTVREKSTLSHFMINILYWTLVKSPYNGHNTTFCQGQCIL